MSLIYSLIKVLSYFVNVIGFSCSGCMADVRGPYRNLTAVYTLNVDMAEANESVPAVFYCTFTCEDSTLMYDFRLYRDVIYDRSQTDRSHNRHFINLETEDIEKKHHFNITTNTISSCNLTNNEATYEIQIYLFIDQETPIIIPKCAVEYNSNLCFSFDTFVIIPSITAPTTEEPTSTSTSTSTTIKPISTSIEPISTTVTMEPTSTSTNEFQTLPPTVISGPHSQPEGLCMHGCISYSAFGSGIGVLGVLLATESAVLILLVCCLFKKSKNKIKPQDTSGEMVIINNRSNSNGANRSNYNKASSSSMTTSNLPQSSMPAKNNSDTATISTISI